VNQAIGKLKDSGELDEITQQWMSESADAPVLQ
jgi:ABC-type amino acid transport substrate-binding protein